MLKEKQLKIEYLDLDKINTYQNNTKLHPPKQIRFLKESISKYGFTVPIKFSGFVLAGAFGMIKNKYFKFDTEHKNVDDYLISGINAFYFRKALIDTRFCCVPKDTFHNTGGLSEFRSLETEKEDTLFLRKKFGESLIRKKSTAKAKVFHQYGRTLSIPF